MELGRFDKDFVKNTRKKVPQGKILELFLIDTLKTTFRMENLTHFSPVSHFYTPENVRKPKVF